MHITIAPKAYSNIAYNIHLHVDLLFMQTNKLFNARRSLWICNNWTKSNLLLIQPFTEAIIQTNCTLHYRPALGYTIFPNPCSIIMFSLFVIYLACVVLLGLL